MGFSHSLVWLFVGCLLLAPAGSTSGEATQLDFGLPLGDVGTPSFLADPKVSVSRVEPGSDVKVALLVTIPEGWHVNAHHPSESYLIGTSIEVTPMEGFIVTDMQYPTAKSLTFSFEEKPLDVYDGTFPIFMTIKVSEKVTSTTYDLSGKLRVQACNDEICLAPTNVDFVLPLVVSSDGAEIVSQHQDLFADYVPGSGTTSSRTAENQLAAVFDEQGALFAFAAIFLVGLALNLTPCVYPMLSVTVSLFGSQSNSNSSRSFVLAITYVLGIATMYSVLGVSAAFSGSLFGSWLQSPWVLGGIGVLLLGLSLSMFGVYQLRMPYWLTQKLHTQQGVGLVGFFFSGLVVGVFAAPCIGPPVIALLTLVGTKGDPIFGFWAFFILSMGLGFPYLILGTFSGMLKRIPRSGVWMVWIERIFGVVLVGAGLFYFSLALFPSLSPYVVPVTLIIGGIYLGFIEPSGRDRRILQRFKWSFGFVAVVFGLWTARALQEPGITWEPYSEDKLEIAQADGKAVLLDFFADWCIPCIELDRKTFTEPRVIAATQNFARLKVDLTHFDSPEVERIRKKFEIAGVPTIVFIDETGQEVRQARVVGYIPSEQFMERIRMLNPTGI